MVAIDTVERGD